MVQLSKEAKKVLLTIIDMIGEEQHIKLDNNGPNSGIMPLCVEVLAQGLKHQSNERCFIISLAHYYEQNGDLMADPSMEFFVSDYRHIVGTKDMKENDLLDLVGVWPSNFRQDGIFGKNIELLVIEDGKVTKFNKRMREYVTFCSGWFKNIKWQQNIKVKVNPTPSFWGKQALKVPV